LAAFRRSSRRNGSVAPPPEAAEAPAVLLPLPAAPQA